MINVKSGLLVSFLVVFCLLINIKALYAQSDMGASLIRGSYNPGTIDVGNMDIMRNRELQEMYINFQNDRKKDPNANIVLPPDLIPEIPAPKLYQEKVHGQILKK